MLILCEKLKTDSVKKFVAHVRIEGNGHHFIGSVATQIQYSCHIHLLEMHSRYERQNNNEKESSRENDLSPLISHLQ